MKLQNEAQTIVEAYKSGATTIELAKKYKVSDRTIASLLRKERVELRRAVRRSKIKHHGFFKTIDTPRKAYFLGMLITDGSIIIDKRPGRAPAVQLMLKADDIDILHIFADEVGADRSVVKISNRNEAYFRFTSIEMVQDLAQYGMIPRKTEYTYIPDIREDLKPHLLRGMFDGDGTVYIKDNSGKPQIRFGIYGTKKVCKQFRDTMVGLGLNHNKPTAKIGVYLVAWAGHQAAQTFYDYVYTDANAYLKRKRNVFDKMLIPR